jgi:secreted trypsin-like serine protease
MPSTVNIYFLLALVTLTHGAYRQIKLENRIMRGLKADIQNFPWMVALFKQPNYFTIGSGTVIAPSWVLTAAHTFKNR